MQLESLDGCTLIIGSYPKFRYNASGGGGKGHVEETNQEDVKRVYFDPDSFQIPSLTWRNTKFLGLPLPPSLKISISMDMLSGTFDIKNGTFSLAFEARFKFTIGEIIKAPELIVKTNLSTEKITSNLHKVKGSRLNTNGEVILIGVANIEPTTNNILNIFLGLPNEALAVLRCKITGIDSKYI